MVAGEISGLTKERYEFECIDYRFLEAISAYHFNWKGKSRIVLDVGPLGATFFVGVAISAMSRDFRNRVCNVTTVLACNTLE